MDPNDSVELAGVDEALASMGRLARTVLASSAATLISNETLVRRMIVVGDDQIDEAQGLIHTQAFRLLEGDLSPDELQLVMSALRVSLHLERIGDVAVNVATLGSDAARVPIPPDTAVLDRLHEMGVAATAMLERALLAFAARDGGALAGLVEADHLVDEFDRGVFRAVVDLGGDRRWREWGLRMEQISRQFERAAHHAVGIVRQGAYLSGVTAEDEAGRTDADAEVMTLTSAAGPGRASR